MIDAVRRLRNYRDSVGAPPAARIPARLVGEAYDEFPGDDRPPRALRHHDGRQRRRGRQLDRARGRDRRGPAERHGRPGRGTRAHRGRARATARRDRARPRQAREQGVHGQGAAGSSSRPSGRSSSASRPSWPSSRASAVELPAAVIVERDARRRALPGLARDVRHALRPRAHAEADDGARLAARALPLDPRAGLERQVVDGEDDRGAARAPRPALPAPTCRRTWRHGRSASRSARGRSPTSAWRRRSPAWPRPPRSWIARSAPAIA